MVLKVRALVAAAGRGTRAGLPFPKTLYPVQGKPILVRILEQLAPYDEEPTVVVSPEGKQVVAECLIKHNRTAHLVEQPAPRGMGDAVLRFEDSIAYSDAEHVVLIWGDIPFVQAQTISGIVARHLEAGNHFTFATRFVDSAYTLVRRDASGRVIDLNESREMGVSNPSPGERDVGLFVFRKEETFQALREDVPERVGNVTGEHGFLYVVGLMVSRGLRVEAVPIATELDLVSLNSLKDLSGHE